MKITVLIVDDKKETRQNIKTILEFDERIEVAGQAKNGQQAIKAAKELSPHVILMDVNMPVLDGLKATEEICLTNPNTSIIIMSVQGEQEYLKKAMAAGAREYIIKPFSSHDLIDTIVRVFEMEEKRKSIQQLQNSPKEKEEPSRVITVFSTKGGVGSTTIAVNLAISIANNTKKSVALVDLDLEFGDVAFMLNIAPKKTLFNLMEEIHSLNSELIEDYLITHFSGVRILCAPARPEQAEYITAKNIEKIIKLLKRNYCYIVLDTNHSFTDISLTALDLSDDILLVSTVELPTIKNIKIGLDVMQTLNYPKDKIKLILNRASEQYGVKYRDIEEALELEIFSYIPEDTSTIIPYANKGFPFILARSEKKVSKSIDEAVGLLLGRKQKSDAKWGILNFFI